MDAMPNLIDRGESIKRKNVIWMSELKDAITLSKGLPKAVISINIMYDFMSTCSFFTRSQEDCNDIER